MKTCSERGVLTVVVDQHADMFCGIRHAQLSFVTKLKTCAYFIKTCEVSIVDASLTALQDVTSREVTHPQLYSESVKT
jgi:hypothetical protein